MRLRLSSLVLALLCANAFADTNASEEVLPPPPIYKANDPNCCPTGGFAHDRYHWSGGRFVLLRSYHTKTYKP